MGANSLELKAHELIGSLDPHQLGALVHLLDVIVEPLSRSLALASVEEEEFNAETAEAIHRAKASLARGEGIPTKKLCGSLA